MMIMYSEVLKELVLFRLRHAVTATGFYIICSLLFENELDRSQLCISINIVVDIKFQLLKGWDTKCEIEFYWKNYSFRISYSPIINFYDGFVTVGGSLLPYKQIFDTLNFRDPYFQLYFGGIKYFSYFLFWSFYIFLERQNALCAAIKHRHLIVLLSWRRVVFL